MCEHEFRVLDGFRVCTECGLADSEAKQLVILSSVSPAQWHDAPLNPFSSFPEVLDHKLPELWRWGEPAVSVPHAEALRKLKGALSRLHIRPPKDLLNRYIVPLPTEVRHKEIIAAYRILWDLKIYRTMKEILDAFDLDKIPPSVKRMGLRRRLADTSILSSKVFAIIEEHTIDEGTRDVALELLRKVADHSLAATRPDSVAEWCVWRACCLRKVPPPLHNINSMTQWKLNTWAK